MAFDFKKLSDPVWQAERKAEEAAHQAIYDRQVDQLEQCMNHIETLATNERSFIRSCRTRLGMRLGLSDRQAKWLGDIAKRLQSSKEEATNSEDDAVSMEKTACADLDLTANLIQVITTIEFDEKTERQVRLVSHGIDMETGEAVILPCEPVEHFPGLCFDENLGHYLRKGAPEDISDARSGRKMMR